MTDDNASANVSYKQSTPYQMGNIIPWTVYSSSGMALPDMAVLPSVAEACCGARGLDHFCYVYVYKLDKFAFVQ